jgi:broad specificity phosphatase PhoE
MDEILSAWQKYFMKSNLILIRHAQKRLGQTSTNEELSVAGESACRFASNLLEPMKVKIQECSAFFCNGKARARKTLELIFQPEIIQTPEELAYGNYGQATKEAINQAFELMKLPVTMSRKEVFLRLNEFGIEYPEENPFEETARRMWLGFLDLVRLYPKSIYCSSSPWMELGLMYPYHRSLDELDELGGPMNSLDMLFIKVDLQESEFKLLHRLKVVTCLEKLFATAIG